MKSLILSIDGMTCSACSNGLEKYLNKQNGIFNSSVNLVMANATITYDEKILNQEKIEKYIKQAGFKSLGVFKKINTKKNSKKEKIQFIIFTILAIILMYIAMGHMVGLPIINFLSPHNNPINYTMCLLILAIAFLIYGYDILKNGYKNLIHKIPNMDTLVAIGVISSFAYSLYGVFMIFKGNLHYVMNLYFESSAIIIYFVKLGRYIDKISKDKTKEAIQKLVEITPNQAIIEVNGVQKQVTLDEIKKGDIVISKAGDKIAVDGEIIEGDAHLDESFITGESKPVAKNIGEKVIAGSLNYDGFIKYKAERIGKESTISEIVKLVIEASNTKAPIAKIADKISGYFVPTVIVIAIITFVSYLFLGYDIKTALSTFITVLVVACPCSLGLATPLAIVISEGLCAGNGILVKKSEILENASKINTIVFDKTGTLTYGKLKISKIYNYSNIPQKQLMKMVGSIEEKSTHPIGKAFMDYMVENKIEKLNVENMQNIAGYGIIGTINNEKIILGNRKIIEKFSIENNHLEDEEDLALGGNSIVYVANENKILALIGVNDVVRENAKDVIKELKKYNVKTIMLTGDNKQTAEKIGKELEITEVISNVLPSQKSDTIKSLKENGNKVMMCGDGINDSPALTNADIGVSVKSGTDIAMDSSDVILTKNDLYSILKLIKISEKTVKNIKQNLFWAFFYNCLMIPVAIGFFKPLGISINPMIASLAMVFSSLTVILNALRLKKLKI
ncbi:MAG TPA: heavy metal translocating P-type ATPase [Clostridiaceae bacterium]|nr:heavy metal translocating P-type ATPase [Clostridiaceae bacterium]